MTKPTSCSSLSRFSNPLRSLSDLPKYIPYNCPVCEQLQIRWVIVWLRPPTTYKCIVSWPSIAIGCPLQDLYFLNLHFYEPLKLPGNHSPINQAPLKSLMSYRDKNTPYTVKKTSVWVCCTFLRADHLLVNRGLGLLVK